MTLDRANPLQEGYKVAVTIDKQYKRLWARLHKGPFNNYVGQDEGGRGSKNVCFSPRSGYENCPRRERRGKMAKFCPRSY